MLRYLDISKFRFLFFSFLQQFLYLCGDVSYRLGRLEAGDYLSALVGEELCEVPLDFRAILVVGVCL